MQYIHIVTSEDITLDEGLTEELDGIDFVRVTHGSSVYGDLEDSDYWYIEFMDIGGKSRKFHSPDWVDAKIKEIVAQQWADGDCETVDLEEDERDYRQDR